MISEMWMVQAKTVNKQMEQAFLEELSDKYPKIKIRVNSFAVAKR
jgi:hypothetical protein